VRELFTTLALALEGSALIALAAAVVWGILSILLSPCHLASIPLIIGFIDQQGRTSTRHAFWLSTLFATGILITIGAVGAITASLGRMIGDVGAYGNYFVALILFIVGLHLIGVIPVSFGGANLSNTQRKGLWAALLLGLIFGIALGPCTFAYMAPMLVVALRVASSNPLYSAGLLLAYGVGHCSVIVAAGTSTELVQQYLNWTESSRGAVIVKQVCGVLVVLAGLYMIYIA